MSIVSILRKKLHLTQKKLASKLGVSILTVKNWEKSEKLNKATEIRLMMFEYWYLRKHK